MWKSRVWYMLRNDWKHRLKGSFEIESTACWHRIFWVFIVRSSSFPFIHPTYFESINEKPFGLNNPLLSFATPIPLQMHCVFCFVTWLDYLHCIGDFSLFMQNLLTNTKVVKSRAQRRKTLWLMLKGLNKNGFCFQEKKMRYDAMGKHWDKNIF